MFSPYYARARRRGAAQALDHCAMNVALYGARHQRWAMTERGQARVEQARDSLSIGPSALHWDGNVLHARIDEITTPWFSRLHGTLRITPDAMPNHVERLDVAGLHHWCAIAPLARIEVAFEQPALRWSGRAYLDSNHGDVPLERSFGGWHWSRASLPGQTIVLYDVARHDAYPLSLSLRFDRTGAVDRIEPGRLRLLDPTGWRIQRSTRSDLGHEPAVIDTLEDTPFYARSLLGTRLQGQACTAVHESLDLRRFASPWVQWLLPFRMPRRAR